MAGDNSAHSRAVAPANGAASPDRSAGAAHPTTDRAVTAPEDGIEHEQRYVGVLYERLDDLWAEHEESLRRALRETDGTPQGLTNRDVAAAATSIACSNWARLSTGSASAGSTSTRPSAHPARRR